MNSEDEDCILRLARASQEEAEQMQQQHEDFIKVLAEIQEFFDVTKQTQIKILETLLEIQDKVAK